MSMSDEEIQAHAQRIGDDILSRAEFCEVYEDPEMENELYEDQLAVFGELVSLVTIKEED